MTLPPPPLSPDAVGNPGEAPGVPLSLRIEEQLRRAVEQVPDFAVFALEPDGRVSSWNAGAARLFRHAPADILGRNGRILFTPEDQASGQAEAELARAAQTGRAEEALRAADRRKDEFLAMLAHELRNPLASAAGALGLLEEVDATSATRAWAMEADPVRLEQVLANLLTNAVKFTDPGGRVELTGHRDGDRVALVVRDNGIGMQPERIPAQFELFVQSDRAVARSQGGLGVGLSVARKLVELHGGTLDACSEGPGRGSAFTVRLPAAPPSRGFRELGGESALAEATGPRPTGSRPKVLVVEDNQDLAMGLRLLLELKGYAIQVAHDGLTALEAARRFRPAAVLADLGLPGIDGYELA